MPWPAASGTGTAGSLLAQLGVSRPRGAAAVDQLRALPEFLRRLR
jgi:hypothetical protein